jgi:hypothetical protein
MLSGTSTINIAGPLRQGIRSPFHGHSPRDARSEMDRCLQSWSGNQKSTKWTGVRSDFLVTSRRAGVPLSSRFYRAALPPRSRWPRQHAGGGERTDALAGASGRGPSQRAFGGCPFGRLAAQVARRAAPRSKRLAKHAPATGHLVNWQEPSLPLSVQPLQKLVMAGQLRQ